MISSKHVYIPFPNYHKICWNILFYFEIAAMFMPFLYIFARNWFPFHEVHYFLTALGTIFGKSCFVSELRAHWHMNHLKTWEQYLVIFSHMPFHGQYDVLHLDSVVRVFLKAHDVVKHHRVRTLCVFFNLISFVLKKEESHQRLYCCRCKRLNS